MKKIFALLLAALMVFAAVTVSSCGKNEGESTTAPSENSESTSAPAESETTSAPAESGESAEAFVPEYSKYLSEDGLIEDIDVSECVKIPDFSKISFKESELRASEETIQGHIDSFLATLKENVDDPSYTVKDGDTLNIDYVGSVDGVPFEGGSTQGNGTTVTIGVTSYIDGFLPQLIGHHPGENFDIDVTFPDPYPNNEDLSGKPAVFNITINYAEVAPEISDEFLAAHEEDVLAYFSQKGIKTVDELKTFISDHLLERTLETEIINKLTEDGLPEVDPLPERAMEFAKNMTEITIYNYYGISLEDFIPQSGMTEEQIEETIKGDAKMYLMVQAIALQEGFTVTEDDIRELTGDDNYEGMLERYGRGYIARFALEEKAYEYMKEHIVLE